MITLAFRFDDPSQTSDHALERGIIRLLAKSEVAATFATIPFREGESGLLPLTLDKASHLVKASNDGLIEIAQHGFSHKKRTAQTNGASTEFAGLPEAEQRDLVRQGLAHLGGLFSSPITGFVPPWNSFDMATARVVKGCGLGYLSAGGRAPRDFDRSLSLLPFTCRLREVRDAVAEARRFPGGAPLIVAVMHHYDFQESSSPEAVTNLDYFEGLLAWLIAQGDVRMQTLGEIAATLGRREVTHMLRHREVRDRGRLPWRFRQCMPQYCAIPAPLWRTLLGCFRNRYLARFRFEPGETG